MKLTKNKTIMIYSIIVFSIIIHYNESYWGRLFIYQLSKKLKIILIISQFTLIGSIILLYIFFEKIIKLQKRIFIILMILFILFIFLEIVARLYICNYASSEFQSWTILSGECGYKAGVEPHHYLIFRGTPNYKSFDEKNIHNSYGFRGPEILIPKPNNRFRIITIGGSTIYSATKNWRDDFARSLQRYLNLYYATLNIEVINAGRGGWTSWESLINFEFNVLDLEPDMIIIYQNLDDVYSRIVNPSKYKGDNSGLRKVWETFQVPFFLKSILIRMITKINPKGTLAQNIIHSDILKIDRQNEGIIKEWNLTQKEILETNPPKFFERNLKNMIAISKEYNISVVLATWAGNPEFGDFINTSHYQYGYQEQNKIIRKIGDEKRIPVYDFNKEMSKENKYWIDGRHLNENGTDLKGKLFANYIYSKKLIKNLSSNENNFETIFIPFSFLAKKY